MGTGEYSVASESAPWLFGNHWLTVYLYNPLITRLKLAEKLNIKVFL